MREIRWSALKNKWLKSTRGVSFEEIIHSELLGVHKHPARDDQRILVYRYKGYIWVVPFVFGDKGIFLKTIYPSRKLKEFYRKKGIK